MQTTEHDDAMKVAQELLLEWDEFASEPGPWIVPHMEKLRAALYERQRAAVPEDVAKMCAEARAVGERPDGLYHRLAAALESAARERAQDVAEAEGRGRAYGIQCAVKEAAAGEREVHRIMRAQCQERVDAERERVLAAVEAELARAYGEGMRPGPRLLTTWVRARLSAPAAPKGGE